MTFLRRHTLLRCVNVVCAGLLSFPPYNSPADAVAIKKANYPSGLINITIITPLEYMQAVMNMGWRTRVKHMLFIWLTSGCKDGSPTAKTGDWLSLKKVNSGEATQRRISLVRNVWCVPLGPCCYVGDVCGVFSKTLAKHSTVFVGAAAPNYNSHEPAVKNQMSESFLSTFERLSCCRFKQNKIHQRETINNRLPSSAIGGSRNALWELRPGCDAHRLQPLRF